MPDAHTAEKSQALADTLVSYARICMDDEFKVGACFFMPTDVADWRKVSPIELSARQEKIKGFMGVSTPLNIRFRAHQIFQGKVDEWVLIWRTMHTLTNIQRDCAHCDCTEIAHLI